MYYHCKFVGELETLVNKHSKKVIISYFCCVIGWEEVQSHIILLSSYCTVDKNASIGNYKFIIHVFNRVMVACVLVITS